MADRGDRVMEDADRRRRKKTSYSGAEAMLEQMDTSSYPERSMRRGAAQPGGTYFDAATYFPDVLKRRKMVQRRSGET